MGFDDLEAAEQDRRESEAESTAAEAESTAADEEPQEAESTDSGERTENEPAFEFGDVKQSPMYARPEAWQAFEDALDLEVVRALRKAGVRNEAKRELHDAALRVAAEHPDEIADAVRETRDDE